MTCPSAYAAEAFQVAKIMKGEPLGLFMETYADAERTRTLDDIRQLDAAEMFRPSDEAIPNYGLNPAAQWTKFVLRNPGDQAVTVILENSFTFVDRFTVHYQGPDKAWLFQEAGDQVPYSSRNLKTRQAAFRIQLEPGENLFYARSEAVGAHQLPLLIWSHDEFFEHNAQEYGIIGILVGVHVVICLYNLFLFFSLKDRTHLVYVVYVACNLLFQSMGLGLAQQAQSALFPRETISNHEMILSVDLVSISALYFSFLFLNIGKRLPAFAWIFLGIACMDVLNILINLLYSVRLATSICLINASMATAALIMSGFIIARQGYRPAFFYLAAWSWYIIGVTGTVSNLAGLLPTSIFTRWGQFAGGALEVSILSLALGAKINDKRQRQVKKINELNQALETKVAELMNETACRKSMAAKAAHHLNNPIQAISGLAASTIREEKLIWKRLEVMFPEDGERTAEVQEVITSLHRSFQSLEQNSAMTLKAVKRAGIITNELRIMSGVHGIEVQRVSLGEFWSSLDQEMKEDEVLALRPIKLAKLLPHEAAHDAYIELVSFSKSIFYVLKEAFEGIPAELDIHLAAKLASSASAPPTIEIRATVAKGMKDLDPSEWRELAFCQHLLSRFGCSIQLQSSQNTLLLEIGLPAQGHALDRAA
jgi:signal transduction histidine kinase